MEIQEGLNAATKEGFEKVLELHLQFCREVFEEKKELSPFALVLIRRHPDSGEPLSEIQTLYVSLPVFGTPDINSAFAQMMPGLCRKTDAVGVLLSFEAWTAKESTKDGTQEAFNRAARIRPSERLDRQEALCVVAEHVAIEKPFMCRIEIHREGGKVWLGEKVERTDIDHRSRMWDLMGRKKGN